MPIPLIVWGGLAVVGIGATAVAANEVGEASERAGNLVKWATVGGALYVSYRAMKSAGVIK
jgi:hypothetical protein